MNIKDIASIVGAAYGGEDLEITSMNALKDAKEGQLSFISNAKYVKDIAISQASAILVDEKTKEYVPDNCVALVVDNPYMKMAILSKSFAPLIEDSRLDKAIVGEGTRISPKAEIAHGVRIGKNCTILAHVYIGTSCVIGDNTVIYPNTTIYRDSIIGSDCVIHSNTAIGADGFGFATNASGEHTKIYQNGNVVIEDDVEIGSNVSIDRAVFGSTRLQKGVRIDNLIQVGHNCVLGEYSVLVAQSGIAGSTTLGRNVVLGGQSAIAGHLTIAPFTSFAARSGVTKSIKESGLTFAGFPLMEHKPWLKLQSKIAKLLK
ncbi:UDP-3-O-(3-hydroxymyristoyl)glucosamine N-acyltransferase [Sulfurimonas sp. SAG-AH-194-I05]|nr:UDP-3-O-(3-hydroxymyristoyl)glucosamine N-acyltransferase [Sulfurimonas sp. SAG-AH-194-I05]MDF1875456.1 UDP-3-O-(3-hydroxymyristoyl)glucosamine N-acyltransferase [Sulfurimonas sp. SAG-AH-194-I05]